MNDIKEAVKIVTNAIKNDAELFYAYQANIAVQFQDAFARNTKRYKNRHDIHAISNEAAKNFLNLWIAVSKKDERK
jgi:hypothetical protein